MRKIIDGLRYDTETAIKVGEVDAAGLSRSDFRWYHEGLYRTPRSGKFFLAGEGGPLTHWARSTEGGRARIGGSGIKPLPTDQARAWCETELDGEDWAVHFEIQDA